MAWGSEIAFFRVPYCFLMVSSWCWRSCASTHSSLETSIAMEILTLEEHTRPESGDCLCQLCFPEYWLGQAMILHKLAGISFWGTGASNTCHHIMGRGRCFWTVCVLYMCIISTDLVDRWSSHPFLGAACLGMPQKPQKLGTLMNTKMLGKWMLIPQKRCLDSCTIDSKVFGCYRQFWRFPQPWWFRQG